MILKLTVPASGGLMEMRVLSWHKQVGDVIEDQSMLLELETDKAVLEVVAKQGGYLRRVLVKEGEWYTLGTPIALFSDDPSEAISPEHEATADLLVAFQTT